MQRFPKEHLKASAVLWRIVFQRTPSVRKCKTMEHNTDISIAGIISTVLAYQPHADAGLIKRAYDLAEGAHEGQTRKSGEAYIIHPLNVARILTDMHMDDATVSAALLHDVVEDTSYTIEDIQNMFGKEVAMLVGGVTKLSRVEFKSKEERQLENYRRMFLAMADDIRVIIIKLADRLHNMRTLKFMSDEARERIAKETIDIYAPLANRLGISSIKWELEDLCLRYLEPKTYYELVDSVDKKRRERQSFIDAAIASIWRKLADAGLASEISGRAKHFYSIYKKMKRDGKDISEIYDLSAIRILVPSVKDCYGVLGVIHAMWKPLPGRFKDYIAMPKSNGYQSLHTTVMTADSPLEIQIRTFKMHQVSEYGVAAHWKYKEAGKNSRAVSDMDQKMSWLRQLINLQNEFTDPKEYFEALKADIFSGDVFVFTPKGDAVSLPKGATPVDFAYRIHTQIGHTCVGAKVNGRIVTLDTPLKHGDIVSVITNKNSNGPSLDWLNFVASSETRNKIRSWFKKEKREENIENGRDLLEKELKRLNYPPKELLGGEHLAEVAKKFNVLHEDDLLASLGYGGIPLNGVVTRLIDIYKKEKPAVEATVIKTGAVIESANPTETTVIKAVEQKRNTPREGRGERRQRTPERAFLVAGQRGMTAHAAKCCSPIPGDQVIGFVTRGRGVTVHRADCPNILAEKDLTRVIEVGWDKSASADKEYTVELSVVAADTDGVLQSIITVPQNLHIRLRSMSVSQDRVAHTGTVSLSLDLKNAGELADVTRKLKGIKDVYSVTRKFAVKPQS